MMTNWCSTSAVAVARMSPKTFSRVSTTRPDLLLEASRKTHLSGKHASMHWDLVVTFIIVQALLMHSHMYKALIFPTHYGTAPLH